MSDKKTIQVKLGPRSYEIHAGAGVIEQAGALIRPLAKRAKLALVTERNVARHHLSELTETLEKEGFDVASLVLEPGENTKDWANLQTTVEWLLDQKVERDDLVIALGGGVIGDLVGFAAAILRRGVRFVQIPTSLLAQVDSSVGGKTGINSVAGKNLVGAFHQPSLVLADVGLLSTLSDRDFLSGYGEVVKYGLLGDSSFFEWLDEHAAAMRDRDPATILEAVARSCQMKADIVARDETERGDRALLNLGHTFGHALEAATGYSARLLHGEGVSIGCCLAFELSMRMGLCAQETPSRVRAHFQKMNMRTGLGDIPGLDTTPEALVDLMRQDKKSVAGQVKFILARDIGAAFVSTDVDLGDVAALLADEIALIQ